MSRFSIIDCDQRTERWHLARSGRATGSRANCVLAKAKSGNGEAVTRRDYRLQLAVEIITGQPQDEGYSNHDMRRGADVEHLALGTYEARSGNFLRRTGFISMSEVRAGCSLDGDVNDFEGIVEVKCPKMATHVSYIRAARVPPEYVAQCTHDLWVTGAQWVDFVSHDERMPPHLQYFCVRAYRNEFDIDGYEKELTRFLAEVAIEVRELQKLRAA